jgi:3-methyladenine DNA glycosylase/8-oxoguanine DNA glycosylase
MNWYDFAITVLALSALANAITIGQVKRRVRYLEQLVDLYTSGKYDNPRIKGQS